MRRVNLKSFGKKATNLNGHERVEQLALQRRGPEDALDLGQAELGEVDSPLHGAASLPLQFVAAFSKDTASG